MKKMKELQNEQEKLIEELEILKIKVQKKTQDVETIANKITELKEQLDYGSFKFVHANMPKIIDAIAPKHKLPKEREINISSSGNTPMIANISWGEKCSDKNPCNANICPRCTLIYFKSLLDRLLAGYYAK